MFFSCKPLFPDKHLPSSKLKYDILSKGHEPFILIAFNSTTFKKIYNKSISYFSPPAYVVVVPESISSNTTHGAGGSETELECEFIGVTGEPCICITNNNPKATKPSYIHVHNKIQNTNGSLFLIIKMFELLSVIKRN